MDMLKLAESAARKWADSRGYILHFATINPSSVDMCDVCFSLTGADGRKHWVKFKPDASWVPANVAERVNAELDQQAA